MSWVWVSMVPAGISPFARIAGITLAPFQCAICVAARPTAPAAPMIRIVSPALIPPWVTSADHAVMNGTPTEAACSIASAAGFTDSQSAGTTMY